MTTPRDKTRSPFILIGGGGHALVVADSAIAAGITIAGFFDDDAGAVLAKRIGLERLGGLRDFASRDVQGGFVLTVGDLRLREELVPTLSMERVAAAIVHPSAVVAPSASVGRGVFIGPGAIINALATIAAHAIINSGAIIEHEVTIGMNSHIAPGAILAGRVAVGRAALIGLGAMILPGLRIGDGAIVGAGAVVTRDVAPHTTIAGNPARSIER